MARDSKRVRYLRRESMKHNDRSPKVQEMKFRGYEKIWRLLERGMKRPKSVAAMFDAEDKRKRKVRKNYPKFARV